MFLLAVGVMCLTACAQKKKDGERGPRQGGHMVINKDSDSVFAALKQETLGKFKQLTYNDKQTSTAGKEVTAPLTQGYGALEFASNRDQQKHPSFVLVPQYTDWAVQDDWSTTDEVEMTIRLLTYPDLFAASLFVSSQWDTSKMQDFGKKHFFYIVAGGDQKASGGMRDLAKVLKENNARVDSASWSAKLPSAEQEKLAEKLIARESGRQAVYSLNQARVWSTWHLLTTAIRLQQCATGCSCRVNRL